MEKKKVKKVFKRCVVPGCNNASLKNPEKLFVNVPLNVNKRKQWFRLAGISPCEKSMTTVTYYCEDHFDAKNDIVNYNQHKMGLSVNVLLEKGVLPSKFDHLESWIDEGNRQKRTHESAANTHLKKKTKFLHSTESLIEYVDEKSREIEEMPCQSLNKNLVEKIDGYEAINLSCKTCDKEINTDKIIEIEEIIITPVDICDKAVNADILILTPEEIVKVKLKTTHFCNKAEHTVIPSSFILSNSTFPIEISATSRCTSLDESDSNMSGFMSTVNATQSCQEPSAFVPNSSEKYTIPDTDNNALAYERITKQFENVKNTMHTIFKKPMLYIGISKNNYYLINFISNKTSIPVEHILLCLKKIRLNNTFSELEDNFGISFSYGSKLFLKNIPIIASVLRPFIVSLSKLSTLKTLPHSFRYNYYQVSCIIDSLEIEIEKPSKAVHQALTWSEYYKRNTIKYLISWTPNGLINYISPGFGGRISDVTLIENSIFLAGLEPGTFILADRGFKNIGQALMDKGIQLLSPPSVQVGSKLSKEEVRRTKIIASLRIHVERVIRRIREFHMLEKHSVINTKLLSVLDEVVVIACALVNIQDSLSLMRM